MNKEKFERKCKELNEHEEKVLKEAENYIGVMHKSLTQLGLKIRSKLFWNYFGDEKNYSKRISVKDQYTCLLNISIYRNEDNPDNEDLECICFVYPITQVHRSPWIGTLRLKYYHANNLFINVNNVYNKILVKGYEAVLNELRK